MFAYQIQQGLTQELAKCNLILFILEGWRREAKVLKAFSPHLKMRNNKVHLLNSSLKDTTLHVLTIGQDYREKGTKRSEDCRRWRAAE